MTKHWSDDDPQYQAESMELIDAERSARDKKRAVKPDKASVHEPDPEAFELIAAVTARVRRVDRAGLIEELGEASGIFHERLRKVASGRLALTIDEAKAIADMKL